MQSRVLLMKRDGSVAEFTPYGVDKITGNAVGMSLEKADSTFPVAARKLESPEGPIHMLVGVAHMRDAPRGQERGRERWVAAYPFNTLVGRLIDNY
jgi:hypothetical protein